MEGDSHHYHNYMDTPLRDKRKISTLSRTRGGLRDCVEVYLRALGTDSGSMCSL